VPNLDVFSHYCDQVRLADSDLLYSITPPQEQLPFTFQVDGVSLVLVGTEKSPIGMITVHKLKPLCLVLDNGTVLAVSSKFTCTDKNAFLIRLEQQSMQDTVQF